MSRVRFIILLSLLLSMTLFNASETIKQTSVSQDVPETTGEFPIESFVQIKTVVEVEVLIAHEGPTKCPKEATCDNYEIATLVKKSMSSGAISWVGHGSTLVMTAGHSCVSEFIESAEVKIVKQEFHISTGHGVSAMATVLLVEEESDLCMLLLEKNIGPPMKYASESLPIHSKIRAMSSPLGLGSPYAIPVFEGRYFGDLGSLRSTFGIPSAPGSSGGPVFNDDGEIVSVIIAVANGFHHFSIGTTTSQTYDFLNKSIRALEDSRQNTDEE